MKKNKSKNKAVNLEDDLGDLTQGYYTTASLSNSSLNSLTISSTANGSIKSNTHAYSPTIPNVGNQPFINNPLNWTVGVDNNWQPLSESLYSNNGYNFIETITDILIRYLEAPNATNAADIYKISYTKASKPLGVINFENPIKQLSEYIITYETYMKLPEIFSLPHVIMYNELSQEFRDLVFSKNNSIYDMLLILSKNVDVKLFNKILKRYPLKKNALINIYVITNRVTKSFINKYRDIIENYSLLRQPYEEYLLDAWTALEGAVSINADHVSPEFINSNVKLFNIMSVLEHSKQVRAYILKPSNIFHIFTKDVVEYAKGYYSWNSTSYHSNKTIDILNVLGEAELETYLNLINSEKYNIDNKDGENELFLKLLGRITRHSKPREFSLEFIGRWMEYLPLEYLKEVLESNKYTDNSVLDGIRLYIKLI